MNLRQQTVSQMLSETVAKYPQRPAVRWADGCWSYTEFDREITKMAKGFLSLGLTIGSHAALWTEPSPRAVAAFFALQRIGAVVILLNTCLKGGEIEKQLMCSDAEYVILEGEEKAQSFLEACRSGREASFAEGELFLGQTIRVKTVLLSQLPDEPAWAQSMPAPDPNAVAMMLFTSGTTSANYKVFHTQIGVGNRLDGGRRRVKKYLWSFLRTAPAGQVRL